MYDIFYLNEKPNLFEFEVKAKSKTDAAKKSRTKRFWLVDSLRHDPERFDFYWNSIPSQKIYNHGFSDKWSRDLGIYLYLKGDIEAPVAWHNIKSHPSLKNWKILFEIDSTSFDFSWHPSIDDPEPYIYVFGNQWYPAEVMPTIEYHVPGATTRKYINELKCRLKEDKIKWEIPYD